MKAIAQTLLVGCGVLGLIPSLVAAVHRWSAHREAGGPFSATDIFTLLGPLLCGAAVAAGIVWQHRTKRNEPRRRPGQLTEDPGG